MERTRRAHEFGFESARAQRGGGLQVILGVIGAILIAALVVTLVGVWVVSRYTKVEVSRNGEEKRVAVRTPFGEFVAEKGTDALSKMHLPVYPKAEVDEEAVTLRLWGRVEDEEGGLTIAAASFYTSDSLDQVDAWYQKQLGMEFTRETGHIVGNERRSDGKWVVRVEPGGDDVLYKRETEGRVRAVALRREFDSVKIDLFDLREARHQ